MTAAGYFALALAAASLALHGLMGTPAPNVGQVMAWMLRIDLALLVWRIGLRILHTMRVYGWNEGVWAVPRVLVGNLVAAVAICRALARYVRVLRGGVPRWEKTEHAFPDLSAEGAR